MTPNTDMSEQYTVGNKAKDGAAIIMAMLPSLMKDEEFRSNLAALESEYQGGFTNIEKATELMGLLCDNAYRRVCDSSCAAHLPVNIDILEM